MKRDFFCFVYLVCGVIGILGGLIGGFMFLAFLGLAFFDNYEAFSPFDALSSLPRRLIGGVILLSVVALQLVIGLLTPYLLTHKRFPWQTPEQKVEKLIKRIQNRK